MIQSWRWFLVVGVVCLSGAAGCHSMEEAKISPPPATLEELPPPVRNKKDLPPEESAKVCLTTAREMDAAGNEAAATVLYEKARALDPRYKSVARRLAVLYDRQEMFAKAIEEHFMPGGGPNILNDMGYTHYNHGKFKDAEDFLKLALEAKPDNQRAWVNLGMTLGAQERYGESMDAFCKVMPEAQAHCNLAFLLTTQKHLDEAKQEYRMALRLDPSLGIARAALDKLENPGKNKAQAKKPRDKDRGHLMEDVRPPDDHHEDTTPVITVTPEGVVSQGQDG
jgi:Tfp pilus assembly protein PilF